MLLNLSILFFGTYQFNSFLYARGSLLIGRKGMHYAEVYMCIEHHAVFICQLYPRKHADIYSNLFLLRKLFSSLQFTLVELSDQFNTE